MWKKHKLNYEAGINLWNKSKEKMYIKNLYTIMNM